jgi:hypothetical protein
MCVSFQVRRMNTLFWAGVAKPIILLILITIMAAVTTLVRRWMPNSPLKRLLLLDLSAMRRARKARDAAIAARQRQESYSRGLYWGKRLAQLFPWKRG